MIRANSPSDDAIDKASIIENKEKIKIYWEQKMTAAANESKSLSTMRQWRSSEFRKSPSRRLEKISDTFGGDLTDAQKARNIDSQDSSDSESELSNNHIRRTEKVVQKDRFSDGFLLTMEGKIAMELEEMKEREKELKEWRNKIANENEKEIPASKDTIVVSGHEELSSLHTTDDSNYSEYGSEEKEHSWDDGNSRVDTPQSGDFVHLRTQSLDSVSSGHSSGSGSTLNERDRESPRRRALVRPYQDPEEEQKYPSYTWDEKETPIEKEIRLTKEREEELRREKGTTAITDNCNAFSCKIKIKSGNKKVILENDPRGIQHRLATCRIQQEIEEANERERELRTEGKIISTSEETLDSKVTRLSQLVENSLVGNRYKEKKMKRSLSTSHLMMSPKNEEKARDNGYESLERNSMVQTTNKYISHKTRRGLMQQFFSTGGKPFATSLNLQSKSSEEEFQSRPVVKKLLNSNGDLIICARKGYVPVAEKIQEELIDNQKREEELRLQRAQMFPLARSHPNLLDISENEEEPDDNTWSNREEPCPTIPRLVHSYSNPNLLDECFEKLHKRSSSKKFSLLEEWEKRIRENVQKD